MKSWAGREWPEVHPKKTSARSMQVLTTARIAGDHR
jgi:hypothetical protein